MTHAHHLLSLQLGSLFGIAHDDGFLDASLPAQCSVRPANIVVNRPGVGRVSALIGDRSIGHFRFYRQRAFPIFAFAQLMESCRQYFTLMMTTRSRNRSRALAGRWPLPSFAYCFLVSCSSSPSLMSDDTAGPVMYGL